MIWILVQTQRKKKDCRSAVHKESIRSVSTVQNLRGYENCSFIKTVWQQKHILVYKKKFSVQFVYIYIIVRSLY